MLLLDANIFLELMLDQEKANECEELLAAVEDGSQEAAITELILDSIIIIMENKGKDASELAAFLSSIAAYKGLKLYWLSLLDRLRATVHMSRLGLDFEDSTTLEASKRINAEAIVSFDKHFDQLQGIKRMEPKEALTRTK